MTGLHLSYFYISQHFALVVFETAFENDFYKIFFSTGPVFVTPTSLLNHGVFDFVYICKDYGSDPILFVQRW